MVCQGCIWGEGNSADCAVQTMSHGSFSVDRTAAGHNMNMDMAGTLDASLECPKRSSKSKSKSRIAQCNAQSVNIRSTLGRTTGIYATFVDTNITNGCELYGMNRMYAVHAPLTQRKGVEKSKLVKSDENIWNRLKHHSLIT